MDTQVPASHHTRRIQEHPAAVLSRLYRVAVYVTLVASAKKHVTLIFEPAALLAVEIVAGSGVGIVAKAVVRRGNGLFVLRKAFLLLMLFVWCQHDADETQR